jgi:hypothetical protein
MAVYDPRGGGNVHIDQVLTDISVAWPNNDFVGDRLFPVVTVRKQSDKYYIFGREAWGLPVNGDLRAPGTPAMEVPGLTLSLDTYFAQEHALKIAVTPEERENADNPLQPEADGTGLVTQQLLLGRELAIKNLVTATATYDTGYSTTLSGTAQWSDYTNSDPIGDWRTGVRKIHSGLFIEPNTAVIPYQVMSVLEDHPDFIERIKYSERGILTADIIAAVLGIASVIVPGVGYNSANPGQTASLGYLWGKDVLMAYVPPRAAMKTPAFGYEFCWRYPNGGVQLVDRWFDNDRKADLIRVQRRYQLKMVGVNVSNSKSIAGYLIKAAVA